MDKFKLVSEICDFIKTNTESDITLSTLENRFGINKYKINRIFIDIMGISTKKYLEERRIFLFKKNLKDGIPVPEAVYLTGQNSQSWVSGNSNTKIGMSIRQYRNGGKGCIIKYISSESGIGTIMVAETKDGICSLNIGNNKDELLKSLIKEFPEARLIESDELNKRMDAILKYLDGGRLKLPVDISGTEFQIKVWTAIKSIPYGETRTYSDIALEINMPDSYRAVANACGKNPVPLIIPCHRVIRKNGDIGGYKPGVEKKKMLLEMESKNKENNK